MNSSLSWLFDVSSIGEFFKRLGILIAGVVVFLLYIFAAGGISNYLIMKINNTEGFILISTSLLDSIIFIVTPALTVFFIVIFFMFKREFSKGGKTYGLYGVMIGSDYKRHKSNKLYNLIFIVMISTSILSYVYSINNFYVLFDNKIEKHNVVTSLKHIYSYNDIKEVAIGVKDRGRNGGTLYYKIIFKDNYVINIANNSIAIDDDPIQSLKKFNDAVKNNNIRRTIDKTHFHDLVENLGEQYVKEYENIFAE